MEEIKSCPFCGSTASVESQFGKEWWVQCDNIMNCGSSEGGSTPDEAVQRWNRRAVPQANAELDALLEAAKEVVRDALDNVAVHLCDQHNAAIRAEGLFGSMLKLYEAIRAASKTTPSSGEGGNG